MMKIAVAGTGYVGMSIATLLSQHHRVMAVDVVREKVEKINQRISPIQAELHRRFEAIRMSNNAYMSNSQTKYRCTIPSVHA